MRSPKTNGGYWLKPPALSKFQIRKRERGPSRNWGFAKDRPSLDKIAAKQAREKGKKLHLPWASMRSNVAIPSTCVQAFWYSHSAARNFRSEVRNHDLPATSLTSTTPTRPNADNGRVCA